MAAMVKGVRPLAAMPTTTFFLSASSSPWLGGPVRGSLRRLRRLRRALLSARDDELDQARIEIKGGRTFDGVERGDASAGAGADVDEAAALGERRGNQIDGLRDLREGALDCSGDLGIFTVDDPGDFKRGFAIEIGGGGVCFLGAKAAEVCLRNQPLIRRFMIDWRFGVRSRLRFQASFPKLQLPRREMPGAAV